VVRFYEKEGRRFPWRDTNDPYVILVSELFLQKTTAAQVAKVLAVFLKRWPSIADLAMADVGDIEETIGGLGLRKRARFLKEIAARLLSDYGGKVPRGEALTSLKGVGTYTANAVRCFAFGERVPVVDANVARVLRRYFGISGGKPAYADRELWELAGAILPARRYREFNYGLLDISAKHCRPKPLCTSCPLEPYCSYATRSKER
jgi:A/G-specific adenine glycosylase